MAFIVKETSNIFIISSLDAIVFSQYEGIILSQKQLKNVMQTTITFESLKRSYLAPYTNGKMLCNPILLKKRTRSVYRLLFTTAVRHEITF